MAAGAAEPKVLDPKAPPLLGVVAAAAPPDPHGEAFWPSCAEDPKAGAAEAGAEKGEGDELAKGEAAAGAGAGADIGTASP